MDVLRAGGSALDAVEHATRIVERNPTDHTVGLGGLPNILGEVRLDAAIMDGRTLRAGAVGSVRGHVHAITLARRVMEDTPHVFLVGDGAERLARELEQPEEVLLTPEAEARWHEGLHRSCPGVDPERVGEQAGLRVAVETMNQPMAGWRPGKGHGTVNFIARDREANLASAVSTSGWPWSYPGRLGDSPVIGAGSYADNRWGAAASTGTGEVVLRTSATRSIILYMKMGAEVGPAVRMAMADLRDLNDPLVEHIAIIALDRSGTHVGYSHRREERYAYMTDELDAPAAVDMLPASAASP